jgi:hypothetical protein
MGSLLGSLLFESIWKLFMSKFGLNGMSEKRAWSTRVGLENER